MIGVAALLGSSLTSALFSLGYKVRHRRDYHVMLVLLLLSACTGLFALALALVFGQPVLSRAGLVYGPAHGAAMWTAVFLYFVVASRAKLNVTWTVIQLSIVIPLLFSVLYYREIPGPVPLVGIVLVFAAIMLFGFGREKRTANPDAADAKTYLLLAVSAAFSGIGLVVPKLYAADPGYAGTFPLLVSSGAAMTVLSLVALAAIRGRRTPWNEPSYTAVARRPGPGATNGDRSVRRTHRGAILLGVYMAATSMTGNALLVLTLRLVEGSIAYPLRNALNLCTVFVLSYLLFHERTTRIEFVGLVVAVAGIVCISTGLA
jgi:drug/metabolite transporter (DMT)-like permease